MPCQLLSDTELLLGARESRFANAHQCQVHLKRLRSYNLQRFHKGAFSLATEEQKLAGRIDKTEIAVARISKSLPCMTKRTEIEQVLQAN
jgi:hypothetical protein